MPLRTATGLGLRQIVLHGNPAPPTPQRAQPPPIFGQCPLGPNGWMDYDVTWYGGRPRPSRLSSMGTQLPHKKWHPHPSQFFSPKLAALLQVCTSLQQQVSAESCSICCKKRTTELQHRAHLYSAARPSHRASAHSLVFFFLFHQMLVFRTVGARSSCKFMYLFVYLFISSFISISLFFFVFSSPNLRGRRLDVYHTCTHGVAIQRL